MADTITGRLICRLLLFLSERHSCLDEYKASASLYHLWSKHTSASSSFAFHSIGALITRERHSFLHERHSFLQECHSFLHEGICITLSTLEQARPCIIFLCLSLNRSSSQLTIYYTYILYTTYVYIHMSIHICS